MTGVFAGATAGPTLELLAEVSYPVPEGTTANLQMLVNQVGGLFIDSIDSIESLDLKVNGLLIDSIDSIDSLEVKVTVPQV
jgi:hypothetical protein